MKHYGLFSVTYDTYKKDKQQEIMRNLRSCFVEKDSLVKICFLKAEKMDTDTRWLKARQADYNIAERESTKYSRGPRRYKKVWFIHECDEDGIWKLTKREEKALKEND